MKQDMSVDAVFDRVKRRLEMASDNDRKYERPMNWEEADVIIESLATLRAHNSDSAEPVAWRVKVNYFGRSGWEFADDEQALIDKGLHDREPLYLASNPAEHVAVRPLEWLPGDGVTADRKYFTADTVCGRYWVIEGQWGLERKSANPDNEWFDTDDEAFAAAQADYETRIRSAIASPPAKSTVAHRHKQRGSEYVLIGIGKMQAESWHATAWIMDEEDGRGRMGNESVDMREVAIYYSATDPTEIWVRPREDFEDGRFEALTNRTPDDEVGNG